MTAERGRAKLKGERFGYSWLPPLLIAKECRVIQLLPCPDCQQPTLLPEGVSLEATIECPHCHAQFIVGEMLTARFGCWLLVHDPAAVNALYPVYTEEASEADDSEPLELQAPVAAPLRPKTDWSKFEPVTREPFERMRRKPRSPIWSLVQIVLGGIAAIPISLLLIWHLIGTDVAGAGPRVGRYAPWLVPEKFRPFEDRTEEVSFEPARRNGEPPAAGASGFRRFDDVLGEDANKEPTSSIAPTDFAQVDALQLARQLPGPPEPSAAPVGPAADDYNTDIQSNSVFALIQETITKVEQWSQAVRDESTNLKELALPLYRSLVDVAAAIDAQPAGNPVLRVVNEQMDPIGKAVKDQAALQQVIQQGASYWSKQQSHNAPFSLAMIMEVQSLEENLQGWRLTTPVAQQLNVGGVPLVVEVPTTLQRGLTAGKRYLLLGTVTEPAAETDLSLPEAASAPEAAYFMANYVYAL